MKMKHLIPALLALFLISGFGMNANAQEKVAEILTFKLKVEFHCNGGKAKIEKALKETKGVTEAVADVDTKMVSIKYQKDVVNEEMLVEIIEKVGYRTEKTDPAKKIEHKCGGHEEGDHDHEHNHDH